MILLDENRLEFRFPEVHEDAWISIEFQRTLRIPDDGKAYPLPPGLGRFPLRHLDDYAARLPEAWNRRGGVIMPMLQAEAMWISFSGRYPFALKIAAGKVCAVTGAGWTDRLNADPQDYLVAPKQPWLDGYCVGKGSIRQFVAMPLGEGYTAEEQITGEARHGGLQILACPLKADRYERLARDRRRSERVMFCVPPASGMGLAPGGRMKQDIYEDDFGLEAWDRHHRARCFVTIANSAQWLRITGEKPPGAPITARQYVKAGLPWFDYYGGDARALRGSGVLAALKSVAGMAARKHGAPLTDNEPLEVGPPVLLWRSGMRQVREPAADPRSAR